VSVSAFHLSGRSSTAAGIGRTLRQFEHGLRLVVALYLVLPAALLNSLAAETNAQPPTSSSIEDTNSQVFLGAYGQLQEQLHATQLAIEQSRQEIKDASALNSETLSKALQSFQESFTAQRASDLEAMRGSNKVVLIVVGTFAVMACLTLLLISYFQWRMSRGLAEIAAAVPEALRLGMGSAPGALGPPGRSNLRLSGVMPTRESRVLAAPQTASPALRLHDAPDRAAQLIPFHDPATSLRRRRIRPLRAAVIVGLLCAAALALLLYMVTYRKLGIGYFHDVFKS
jgi:hypothetical protein